MQYAVKTVVGFNFITSGNCATKIIQFRPYKPRSPYDFYVNSDFFFRLREQRCTHRGIHKDVHHAPVSYNCCVMCVISLLFQRKMAIQTIMYHYSVQDGSNYFLVMKTRNKLRFSKHKNVFCIVLHIIALEQCLQGDAVMDHLI